MLTYKKPLNRILIQERSKSKYSIRFVIFFRAINILILLTSFCCCSYSFGENGENKGNAMQKRKFTVLPMVLCVSLLRFRYDIMTGQINKNNKLFKFNAELDLSEYIPDSTYTLQSVLGNRFVLSNNFSLKTIGLK